MNKELSLHQKQRQAPLGVAIIFVQNLRRAINIFLAVVVVNLGSDFSIWGLGYQEMGLIIAAFFLVFSFLQYRKFIFYVQDDNFIIEKGVLRQEKVNVPFARIQSVNTKQNVVQQILNLVGLKIDTAGSAAQEINIHALSRSYAERLQQFLMEQRYEHQGELVEAGETLEKAKANSSETNAGKQELLLRIRLAMLLKVGLSQNHLRSGLVLFAIINGYLWQYEDYLLKPIEPYLEKTAETFLGSWLILLPLAVIIFLLISVISSLVTTVLKYFDFKFYLGSQGMTMESGLLARNTFHVPFSKVQYLQWETNPLQKALGYHTLKVKQAGAEAVNAKRLIGVPGLSARELLKVLKAKYPDRKSSRSLYFYPNKLMLIQRFSWFGVIPVLLASIVFSWQGLPKLSYIPLFLWIPVVYYFAWQYWRNFRMRINKEYLELQKGYVFPKRILIPNFKVQNLALNQSFLQKPRGIATLLLHTAAGSIRVPHLNESEALELYNYLLYKVEGSNRKWM